MSPKALSQNYVMVFMIVLRRLLPEFVFKSVHSGEDTCKDAVRHNSTVSY